MFEESSPDRANGYRRGDFDGFFHYTILLIDSQFHRSCSMCIPAWKIKTEWKYARQDSVEEDFHQGSIFVFDSSKFEDMLIYIDSSSK